VGYVAYGVLRADTWIMPTLRPSNNAAISSGDMPLAETRPEWLSQWILTGESQYQSLRGAPQDVQTTCSARTAIQNARVFIVMPPGCPREGSEGCAGVGQPS